MAGQINNLTFDAWIGRIAWPETRVAILPNLPGIAGRGTATDAAQVDAAQILTRLRVGSLALAQSTAYAAQSLLGQTVRVTEPIGIVWDPVAVVGCRPQIDRETGGTYVLSIAWTLLPDVTA